MAIKASMDDSLIHLGDTVFVLMRGTGRVTAVQTDGSFEVSFPGNSTPQLYLNGGYLGRTRRVFWHDPLFMMPPKNLTLWTIYQNLCRMVCQSILQLTQKGAIDVDKD